MMSRRLKEEDQTITWFGLPTVEKNGLDRITPPASSDNGAAITAELRRELREANEELARMRNVRTGQKY